MLLWLSKFSIIPHSRYTFSYVCENCILIIYTSISAVLNFDKACCSDMNKSVYLFVLNVLILTGWTGGSGGKGMLCKHTDLSLNLWHLFKSWAHQRHLSETPVLRGVVRQKQEDSWSTHASQCGWISKFISQRNFVIGFFFFLTEWELFIYFKWFTL